MPDIVFDKTAFARQLAERTQARRAAEPALMEELRASAKSELDGIAYPDRKQEAWRYTPISGLLDHDYTFAPRIEALQREDLDELDIPGLDSWRAVLVNGRFEPKLSEISALPAGVRLLGLREASAEEQAGELLRAGARSEGDLFRAMNLAGLDDGVVLQIAEGTRIERPIEILHLSLGLDGPSISQPRLVVRLEKDASATLIERYAAFGQSIYFNNVVVDIETLRGARLSHIRIQTESNQAYQVANQSVRQAENSHYSLRSMVAGGAWSRLNIDHRLSGQEASADLKGLYLINGKRFTDLHLKLSHQVPACQSSEDFRGILNGAGRAVFDGNIVVERDAQKTDARLSNDNLMLSRAAEVDTKPQLEIYADDVKCSHGTTVGELDHDSLFYLRSRGIGVDQAKRILCRGFARDLFDDVESPALLHYLIEQIDRRLTEPEEP